MLRHDSSGDGAGPHTPVVVGIDDPETARLPLAYACRQAELLGVELVIVRAWQPESRHEGSGSVQEQADLLDTALAECRASEVEVTGRLVQGPAAEVLVSEALDAQLLVLGGRDRRDGGLGHVAREVLRHTVCPLAIAWLPTPLTSAGDVALAR